MENTYPWIYTFEMEGNAKLTAFGNIKPKNFEASRTAKLHILSKKNLKFTDWSKTIQNWHIQMRRNVKL